MTRGSHAITAAYVLAAAYLAWSAIHTWGRAAVALHIAASVLFLIGILRELDLRDAHRRAASLEQQARWEHEQRNGRPLTQLEAAMWTGLAAQLEPTEPDDPRSSAA